MSIFKLLICLPMVWFISAHTISSRVNAQEMDARTLYRLCARSPWNSRCAGINAATPLSMRSGEEAGCSIRSGRVMQSGKCKVLATDEGLTVFIEEGEPIEFLDNERGSAEIRLQRDRLLVSNIQTWGRVQRVEMGFLIDPVAPANNRTRFLEIITNEDLANSLRERFSLAPASDRLSQALSSAEPAPSSDVAALTQQLLTNRECVGCNLTGANLQGADLEEVNLEGANLQGANLQGANLEEAYLVGANLDQANLTEADLKRSNLTMASLREAVLVQAELQAANLQGANLQQANLQSAAIIAPVMLQNADLSNANLQNARLEGANLANANLTGANLTEANLSDTSVNMAGMPGGDELGTFARGLAGFLLLGAPGALLLGSDDGISFNTNLQGAILTDANLTSANLEDALLKDANLSNANLTNAEISDTDLTGANLCGATMPDGARSNQGCP